MKYHSNTTLENLMGTIAVTGHWKDGRPGIETPRRAATDVTGKLGLSVVVGGTLAAGGGGAIGAALYAAIIAAAGIKDGIEKGKAGKAIHKALKPIFVNLDLGQMVRVELQKLLDETEGQSTPPVAGSRCRCLAGS